MAEEFIGLDFERPIIELEKKIVELKNNNDKESVTSEIETLEKKCDELKKETYTKLTPWQKVQLARHPKRPYSLDYIEILCSDFIELHGDRCFADDKALVCGLAMLENQPVVIIAQQKGRTLQENLNRNFGMMHPEGYRKALRIMKLAEKFHRPILIFIDTPGAYPGIGAEERGQAEAIARNLREMSVAKTPIICVVISEGGSGGALGIGVGDRILMLENGYYSVISPEGCAAILFRDAKKSSEAASVLKLTSEDLYKLGIIDEVIPEPSGGAHRDTNLTAKNIKCAVKKHLNNLKTIPIAKLLEQRYEKYRNIGKFQEKKNNHASNKKN